MTMKKILVFFVFAALMVAAFAVTCRVFDSKFANETIDYFAFFAGIFLIVEGLFKIATDKQRHIADLLSRTFRVIIGTCVFTIHLLQFMRY